jgi:hypothetical protein
MLKILALLLSLNSFSSEVKLEGKYYLGRTYFKQQACCFADLAFAKSMSPVRLVVERVPCLMGVNSEEYLFGSSAILSVEHLEKGYIFVTLSGSRYFVKHKNFHHITNWEQLSAFYDDIKVNLAEYEIIEHLPEKELSEAYSSGSILAGQTYKEFNIINNLEDRHFTEATLLENDKKNALPNVAKHNDDLLFLLQNHPNAKSFQQYLAE